jgi:hypothetical protein
VSELRVVHAEVQRLRRRAWVAGTLLPAAAFVGTLATMARLLADGAWLQLPRLLPLLGWMLAAVAALALGRFLRRRLAQRAEPRAVAAAIEAEQGLRRGSLVGVLEVEGSGVFADFAVAEADRALAQAAARPAPRLRRRLGRAAFFGVLAMAQVLALASTTYANRPDGWRALLHPVDAWRGALVAPLRFADAPSRVQRGGDLALAVDAPGRREIALRWRARGDGWRERVLAVDADGRARVTLEDIAADVTVLASDGRAGRDSVEIAVTDRPFLGDITVTAEYPAYLARGAERLPADQPLRVPEGTRLQIEGRASTPVRAAGLRAGDAALALRADGTRVSGTLVAGRSARWDWEAEGAVQQIADLPPALEIDVLPDSLPRVEILAPTGERMVEAASEVAVELLAQDDYGLREVVLRLQRAGEDAPFATLRLAEGNAAVWSGTQLVRLGPLGLEPGQAVDVTLAARDAAPGNRLALSAPLRLRVPTANEARAAADAAAEAAVAAADAATKAQAALAERTANEARARGDRGAESAVADARAQQQQAPRGQPRGQAPNPASDPAAPREALGYEGAERAREIAQEQQALREQVERLEEASRALEDRLRQAGALDTNLQRQLSEAQRLMREAMTPEMMEAMQSLENATQQLDASRTRQSLQQLAQQQQRMREQLERSAEMLRRAALEGQMQTLADRGQDLAAQQRAMADSAAQRAPSREQAQAMQQQSQDLARQAEQLAQRMEQQQARAGAARTAEAAGQARTAAQQMAEAARDPQAGAQAAQRAADAMQQAAENLAEARERQVGEWKAELTDALDRSVQEMMQLANAQDQLAQQARSDNGNPGLRGQQSALQQGVQTAQQRLGEEARKSALVSARSQELMQRAEQRAAAAAREAAAGRSGQTDQAMREAADALRQAAAQLTRDRERAASSASATGVAEMLRQMQELAKQQGGLNAQMQSILPSLQQQAGQQGQAEAARAQARQMARSQREVARALDDVADADPTGRAQEMAREARALAAALDQGAVDPSTKARQEQLLRRMLDAGRSLENDQRDESSRREARAARGTERVRPDGPGRGAAAERYRVPTWEELRGLSPEDRRLVIEYFRRLNAEERP